MTIEQITPMKTYNFNQEDWKSKLAGLFRQYNAQLSSFGNTVNQTFEAAVLAKTINWHKNKGWKVVIRNPKRKGKAIFRLKFSTRGAPGNYTYIICRNDNDEIEIRHQLRVKTKHQPCSGKNTNICCDIAIIKRQNDLNEMPTDYAIENGELLSFGEVKHMSAFPELIASFIGLVHELDPSRLNGLKDKYLNRPIKYLSPFLYLSGFLAGTAGAMHESIEERNFDFSIYHVNNDMDSD